MIICENNTVFAKSDFWSKTRQPAPVSPKCNNVFLHATCLKGERAEDNALVCSFPILIIIIKIYNTQLLIGDNYLNNHNNNVLAMLLQSCSKHKKTRNSCIINYTSTVTRKLKSSISSDFSLR